MDEAGTVQPGAHWVEGSVPDHPRFDQAHLIAAAAGAVKGELTGYLESGIAKFRASQAPPIFQSRPSTSALAMERCWLLAVKAHKYARIYFLSRSEAVREQGFAAAHAPEIDAIGEYLHESGGGNQIINYAVDLFVRSGRRKLGFVKQFVPPYAIQTVEENHLLVRQGDFVDREPDAPYKTTHALYDLHDFSHMVAATLCSELYGNKYFPHLAQLPIAFKRLVTSPNSDSRNAVVYSDGLVFSYLLTALFDDLDHENLPSDVVVRELAEPLYEYHCSERALFHPPTGVYLKGERPLQIDELAVLSQNKPYELPASEMEQQLFVRGGPGPTDPRDTLAPLPASERVRWIADALKQLTYYERRNILKHRAHKEALRLVAARLVDDGHLSDTDRKFAPMILDHITYKDFRRGQRRNLFHKVGTRLGIGDVA